MRRCYASGGLYGALSGSRLGGLYAGADVEAVIGQQAGAVLKLIDGKVKCGIFEGLKRSGLSDEQAHLAMVRSTNQQVAAQ